MRKKLTDPFRLLEDDRNYYFIVEKATGRIVDARFSRPRSRLLPEYKCLMRDQVVENTVWDLHKDLEREDLK